MLFCDSLAFFHGLGHGQHASELSFSAWGGHFPHPLIQCVRCRCGF